MPANNRLKSIRTKLFIIGLIPVALFALLVLPSNKKSIYNEKKIMVREQVNMIKSIVDHYYRLEVNGDMSREDAQKEVYKIIKEVKYGEFKKDYVWINDYHPKMVLHPFRPDLEGADVSDMKDTDGLYLFREFVKVAKASGEGYVQYNWQYYDDKKRVEPKLSFVTDFKPWGWIIGTGIYIHDVDKTVASQRTSMIIFYLLISFASLLIVLIYAQRLIKPLTSVNTVITTMASGDLSIRYDGRTQEDEVGHIAHSINQTLDNFEKLISDITNAGSSLLQAIQEISRGNEDLSQRTAEQAASIEEIASTVEETVATINNNAINASDANSIAEKTLHLAEAGGKLAEDAMLAISEIDQSGKKIEEIISIIDQVAFQTNLLSLNASIEAARAGDKGRGFAVVANEVRNLAKSTADSVGEISTLIGNSVSSIKKGAELVTRSGQSLNQIIESAREVSRMVESIVAYSDEQRQGIQQINKAITQLDEMTQQNSSLVEETASAGEEISNQANELLNMMREFKIGSMALPAAGPVKQIAASQTISPAAAV